MVEFDGINNVCHYENCLVGKYVKEDLREVLSEVKLNEDEAAKGKYLFYASIFIKVLI